MTASYDRNLVGVFLVRIFLYSVQIQENMDQKKFRIWTLFMQCQLKKWNELTKYFQDLSNFENNMVLK